jgi:hypothetical protein
MSWQHVYFHRCCLRPPILCAVALCRAHHCCVCCSRCHMYVAPSATQIMGEPHGCCNDVWRVLCTVLYRLGLHTQTTPLHVSTVRHTICWPTSHVPRLPLQLLPLLPDSFAAAPAYSTVVCEVLAFTQKLVAGRAAAATEAAHCCNSTPAVTASGSSWLQPTDVRWWGGCYGSRRLQPPA